MRKSYKLWKFHKADSLPNICALFAPILCGIFITNNFARTKVNDREIWWQLSKQFVLLFTKTWGLSNNGKHLNQLATNIIWWQTFKNRWCETTVTARETKENILFTRLKWSQDILAFIRLPLVSNRQHLTIFVSPILLGLGTCVRGENKPQKCRCHPRRGIPFSSVKSPRRNTKFVEVDSVSSRWDQTRKSG